MNQLLEVILAKISRIPADPRHIPEKDAEGNVVSVLGVTRNVTEFRRMEIALGASEAAFRTLAANAPEMIARYDSSLRYNYVNPKFEQVTGLRSEDVIGRTPSELSTIAFPRLLAVMPMLEDAIERGGAVKRDLAWEIDGKPVGWQISAVPEYDVSGDAHGVLTIWADISERLETEQRLLQSNQLLQEATARRESAREEERKRIAREMHDELGQQLTALRLGVSALRIEFGSSIQRLDDRLRGLVTLCDQTMQVVRHVITSLRPAALDAGIIPAIEWLVAEFSRDTGIGCELHIPDDSLELDEERSVAMFRIVQEALTNVARHARACQISVSIVQAAAYWIIKIHDDGCGFDRASPRPNSFGLLGMKERALMLGGDVSISSAPGRGTLITACLPVV
ncbi:PAS domain-containing sensor histidine kinase [Paraburkholderia azotifigens]|uniref:PAS domain-containing sensor histidine kinase n=1 Tax=Paraburkholderia azotifigens TaxID=2057004 RepID=A0ABU9RH58_9BURK